MKTLKLKISCFLVISLLAQFIPSKVNAQSCNPGGPAGTFNFFTTCQAGSSYVTGGNYALTIGNNKTVVINGNVTIGGTLTITLTGSTSTLIIQSPYTLTVSSIVFSGSATGKQLQIDGPSGSITASSIDFGGLTIDIDGGGVLTAGAITGAQNVTCTNDGNCPTINYGACNDGTGNFCDSALPVKLLSFSAQESSESVLLKWSTASQLNFSHFDIEHSMDGENWESLSVVKGEGTTNVLRSYSSLHTFPLSGKNYYRLKMVDLDESFEYSSIEVVNYSSGKSLSLSPNPVNGETLHYELNFTPEAGDHLAILDITGSSVLTVDVTDTSNSIVLPQSVKAGTYIVKYIGKKETIVSRLIVR